ncbi:helix-turn-helix domain-containing protein [Argonema galeatum A003/A1]|nr:helix-turn-helix domain-containing protein [Argonema galeatum A003/A1]
MSSSSSNIDLESNFLGEPTIMIPLSCVSRLTWDVVKGKRLKDLRGKQSRRGFSEKMKSMGYDLSHQYLQELEEGKPESISPDLLIGICDALNVGISHFVLGGIKMEKI